MTCLLVPHVASIFLHSGPYGNTDFISGLFLSAIQSERSQLHEPRRLAKLQGLQEEFGERRQMDFAEVADGSKVGDVVGDDDSEAASVTQRA